MLLIGINIQKRDKKINELLGGVPPMPNMQPNGMPIGNIFDSKPKGGMNVDDLVRRIDAKIAELEAEEAAEKEKQAKAKTDAKTTKSEEKQPEIKKPVVEERKFKREEITDDQFFDDFFGDEDDE